VLALALLGLGVLAAGGAAAETVAVDGQRYAVLKSCPDAQYNFRLDLKPGRGTGDVGKFDLAFAVQDGEHGYLLSYRHPALVLHEIRGGKSSPILRGRSKSATAPKELTLEVRRRLSALDVFFNGVPILESLNSTHAAGQVAVALDVASIAVRNWHYQKYETIRKVDGFMRAPGEKGDWEALTGDWKLWTVRESEARHPELRGREMQQERSANYFAYTGSAESGGVSVIGHAFWDRYRIGVSTKSALGAVGLVFYAQDKDNYYAVRWWLTSRREVAQPLELIRVREGRETVVARAAVPGAAGQWYRLQVDAGGEHVSVEVDSTPVLDVTVTDWFAGKVGLYVVGKHPAMYDDFEVESEYVHHFDRASRVAQCGLPRGGKWRVTALDHEDSRARNVRCRVRQAGKGPAVYWLGDPSWQSYMISTEVRLGSRGGSVGLAAVRRDVGQTLIFRSGRAPGRNRPVTQLLVRSAGGEKILGEMAAGVRPGQHCHLALDLTEKGKVAAFLDERLVLRAADPNPGPGRPGLYTLDAPGTVFDRTRVSFSRPADINKVVRKPLFATDRYMVGWASGAMAWHQAPGRESLYWHKSDFFGRLTLTTPPRRDVIAYLAAPDNDTTNCYEISLTGGEAAAPASIQLKRAGKVVAAGAVAAPASDKSRIHITRDGNYLWAALDDRELFSYRDARPLRGTRVGIKPGASGLANVEVVQYKVVDYLFEKAPVDWRRIGNWEVTNRFVCDPRWSWFASTEWEGLGAIWNKHTFRGDFTLEFYAGMRMARDRGMSYPRTGEINAAVCGDGINLASGYNFITGAWDPSWSGVFSYILRGDVKVAASDRELIPRVRESSPRRRAIPVSWDPGGRPVHGAWYYFRIRKQGEWVRYYFDHVPVMAYRDPSPLTGGHIALWTQDDSIIVARVRVSYEHKDTAPLKVSPLPADGPVERFVVRDFGPADPPPLVHSATHPGVTCAFESDFDGWRTDTPDQGAVLSLDRKDAVSGRSCLKLTNLYSGGTFGAVLTVAPFDVGRIAEMRFKYCIDPAARVNLYFTINGSEYFLPLTGNDRSLPALVSLGPVAGLEADGQWHEARVDLAARVQDVLAGLQHRDAAPGGATIEKFTCTRIRLGNYHQGYLRAGFGGNPQGATVRLDDFVLLGAGSRSVEARWNAAREQVYRYTLSAAKPAVPGADAASLTVAADGETAAALTAEKDGLWYFNVSRKRDDGTWGPARHHAVVVESPSLKLARLEPADAAPWGGGEARLHLDGLTGAVVDIQQTTLKIGDQTVTFDPDLFHFDWAGRALVIQPSRIEGIGPWKDGDKIACRLRLAGRSPATGGDFAWTWTYAKAQDQIPPSRVKLNSYPLKLDFEPDGNGIALASHGNTILRRDPATAAAGDFSLLVGAAKIRSSLGVQLAPQTFHAGKTPILSFDYKLGPHVLADIIFGTGIGTRQIRLSDVDTEATALAGRMPGILRDDRWRHTEINLRQVLGTGNHRLNMFQISGLSLRDTAYVANPPNMSYHIDNITLVPVVSAVRGVELSWHAHDTSGIGGYSYHWSKNSVEDADTSAETQKASAVFRDLPDGDLYFHIRARDSAGQWGPTAHYRFLVDNQPPAVKLAGGNTQRLSETLKLTAADTGPAGIDYARLSFQIEGREIHPNPDLSSFDLKSGALTWDWPFDLPSSEGPRPDGATVPIAPLKVVDFADNEAKVETWNLRVNYATDKTPPSTVNVAGASGEWRYVKTFARGLDGCSPSSLGPGRVSRVLRGGRDYALEVKAKQVQPYGVTLDQNPFLLDEYSFLDFDYRLSPGAKIHIVVQVDNQNLSIALTGHRKGWVAAGQVAGAKADDQWHHASVDLAALRKKLPPKSQGRVRALTVGNLHRAAKPGITFWLDNIVLHASVGSLPQLTLSAWDASGIAGYSYALDDRPDTVPDEEIAVAKRTLPLTGLPLGRGYFHIRARDGAGNWGATVHVPLHVDIPPGRDPGEAGAILCPDCGTALPVHRPERDGASCPVCGAALLPAKP